MATPFSYFGVIDNMTSLLNYLNLSLGEDLIINSVIKENVILRSEISYFMQQEFMDGEISNIVRIKNAMIDSLKQQIIPGDFKLKLEFHLLHFENRAGYEIRLIAKPQ